VTKILRIRDPITTARGNFESALADVKTLLRFHDSETGGGTGRPADELEVLKRAGLVLAVTAWETFVEDTLEEEFGKRLSDAKAPKDIQVTFNSVADAWLQRAPKRPPELEKWTLDGWKVIIREKFEEDLAALNTPSSSNVRELFKRYLAIKDLTRSWRWRGVSSTKACKKLDDLIQLRGKLVHRGRPLFGGKASVRRGEVVEAVELLERLVEKTEDHLMVDYL
jgi:HEPN superfamily RiboL-PSP-like protein